MARKVGRQEEVKVPRERAEKLLDFRKVGAIIQKNFIVLTRDKTRFLPLLLFPIFMILIFGYTTGNVPKHIPTAIIVYDTSPLSQEIQQEISNSDIFSIGHAVSTEGEGKKLLDAGTVRVLVVIPANLQEDFDAGRQIPLTVIVDESDAAVAATSKQTLAAIVNGLNAKLGAQRLSAYQASVGAAGAQLRAYSDAAAQAPDAYATIIAREAAAQRALQEGKGLIDADADALRATLIAPMVYIPPISYGEQIISTANNTFLIDPTGSDATRAQIATLERSSARIEQAQLDARIVSLVAQRARAASTARSDPHTYDRAVANPARAIVLFSRAETRGILQPLVYEEVPAYGTGKRAVDFLIPSIIALTIFQGAVMGMGRAVAGEKREGSLTRVFLTPTSNATIIFGTLSFYVIFEMFRSAFLLLVAVSLFHIKIEGSLLAIALVFAIYGAISTGIGMILSSMVHTEQQYMAMSMLVSMPTMFLAGAFFPLRAMPRALQLLAGFLPVTYAGDALRGIMIKGFSIPMIIYPFLMLLLFLALTLGTLFMVFKRDIE